MLLFVYGTLLKGQRNHIRMLDVKAKLVGAGVTAKKFKMTENAGIPYVSKKKEVSQISGEVYEVKKGEAIRYLDRFEGHPRFYRRERTTIHLEDGSKLRAWLYFCEKGSGTIVPNGNFKTRMREVTQQFYKYRAKSDAWADFFNN